MITIIVHADKVGIFIKDKFMHIAEAMSKYFKIATIGICPNNHSLIRMLPLLSVRTYAIKANIPHRPIDPAVRADFQTRHIVATETDVDSVTMLDGLLFNLDAIAVYVIH